MRALSVTQSAAAAAERGLWCYISVGPFYLQNNKLYCTLNSWDVRRNGTHISETDYREPPCRISST